MNRLAAPLAREHRNCLSDSELRSSQCRGSLVPGVVDPITQPFGGEDVRVMPIIRIAQTLRVWVLLRIYPSYWGQGELIGCPFFDATEDYSSLRCPWGC